MATFQWDEEAERKFSELFSALDTDGSGTLTFNEIKGGALKQGAGVLGQQASDDDIRQFIDTADRDGDGVVSKDEFRTFLQEFIAKIQEQMNQRQPRQPRIQQSKFQWDEEAERKFSELFSALDTDGSGTLTFNEIKNGALKQGAGVLGQQASDDDIRQFIATVDRDGDGVVSKDEFRTFLQEFIAKLQGQVNQQQRQRQFQQTKFDWDEEAERKFLEVFNELDTDGSGYLVFDEIKEGSLKKGVQLMGHNPSDAEIYTFMDKLDVDGDGQISKDEFRSFLQQIIKQLLMAERNPRRQLEEAVDVMMKAIDKDGNGLCSKDEFKAFVQEKGDTPLTDEEVDELFSAVDSDGDKTTLNRQELMDVLTIGMYHSQQ